MDDRQLYRKTPIMGWASWNCFRTNISEKIMKEQADALISTGLAECGYTYLNMDDGFFGGHADDGRLMIGCDLTRISDDTLAILKNKELIAINQDSASLQAFVIKSITSQDGRLMGEIWSNKYRIHRSTCECAEAHQ